MIKLNLLTELVAFQKYDTLAKAAQHLSITQPTVTRGMQQLETEIGVKLFNREPNRITLTPVGKFAAKKAQEVLLTNKNYILQVRHYALSQNSITIAADAPGPIMLLEALQLNQVKINQKLILTNFKKQLLNEQVSCLVLTQPLSGTPFDSIYLGTENLAVHLNKFTALANHQTVKFKDLRGMTFIVFKNIGMWQKIIQSKIPKAKFLYQNNANDFKEIRNNSTFPYFTTTISRFNHKWTNQVNDDRIQVKIKDSEAHQQFYACFLKRNKKRLSPIIYKMQDQWAKADD